MIAHAWVTAPVSIFILRSKVLEGFIKACSAKDITSERSTMTNYALHNTLVCKLTSGLWPLNQTLCSAFGCSQ